METQYEITGIILIFLAFFHMIFPRYFKWKTELRSMSLINQEIMKVHTFFIALVVFLIGLLCLTSADELLNTNLGRKVSLGFGIFWSLRLWMQFFGFSSQLWKGKKMETLAHISFSILWAYLSVTFIMGYLP